MLPRAAIVLCTACLSGLFVGSGLAPLLAPMPSRSRPPPLPRIAIPEALVADALGGGLFAPIVEEPAGPGAPPEADGACEVPWRLVGTMLDRRRPARSFAAIHTPEGARLLAVSMSHSELTLVELDAEAATLERGDGRRCSIRMFTHETTEVIAALPETPAIAEHPFIHRLSSTHVAIDERALEGEGLFDPSVRAIPAMEGGRITGARLYGIRASSPLAAAGLANGDLVSHVDGEPISGPDVALAALGRLRMGGPVRVTVSSRGVAREVTLSVRGPRR